MKCNTRVIIFAATSMALPGLHAQSDVDPGPFSKLFTLGGRASYLPLGLMEVRSYSPPVMEAGLKGTQKFGGGASLEFSFKNRFGVDFDAIYHGIGFQTKIATSTEIVALDTRGRYYDFPLTFRYNYFGSEGLRSHLFVRAGIVLRKVSGLSTSRQVTASDGTVTSDTTGSPLANGTVRGFVAGGGLRFRDEFGLKVTPEVRYTRWLAETFNTSPIYSKRDQLEVMVGITF